MLGQWNHSKLYISPVSGIWAIFWILCCALAPLSSMYVSKLLLRWYLYDKTEQRRRHILAQVSTEERLLQRAREEGNVEDSTWEKVRGGTGATEHIQSDENWTSVIGFFHPFCNAGGGGERVLWAAIRATQKRYPKTICVVYTGDHEATKADILERVQKRFNIYLYPSTVVFLYLSTRRLVLASTWPRFTLLGQSLGSIILAFDALSMLVPDAFIDTMGYAFALGFAKYVFPKMPTGAYVHYPTISTDMLQSLDSDGSSRGLNAGAGKGFRGKIKGLYWQLFASLYGWVGGKIDVVMTNSSWTQAHIRALWSRSRARNKQSSEVGVVFPPVAVEEIYAAVDLSAASEARRTNDLLYIAQFRPEKNHALILHAFAQMVHSEEVHAACKGARLVLIGSVRDSDDATRVYKLRLLVHELRIKDQVEFFTDAPWSGILERLGTSTVGVNGMWNEHFGIGVVEYQAAGLISVVNNSGGPKEDIVVDFDGGPTGYHASTSLEYAAAFASALTLSTREKRAMRLRARSSAARFGDEVFARAWVVHFDRLRSLLESRASPGVDRTNLKILVLIGATVAVMALTLQHHLNASRGKE